VFAFKRQRGLMMQRGFRRQGGKEVLGIEYLERRGVLYFNTGICFLVLEG